MYAPPTATFIPTLRTCARSGTRLYKPKYETVGHRLLTLESEACFVPDEEYVLLDRIIDEVDAALGGRGAAPERESVLAVARIIAATLVRLHFELFIPTQALGDALFAQDVVGVSKHAFDCDTGSFIYLSVAEHLGLPANLVEIPLSTSTSHNYVRYALNDRTILDWDTNGQQECMTPEGLPAYQGRSMSADELFGYAHLLRYDTWRKRRYDPVRARLDALEATRLYPASPETWNDLAWVIVTARELQTSDASAQALSAAKVAVAIDGTPNRLDTLACAFAATGDFRQARSIEARVVAAAGWNDAFAKRRSMLDHGKTCVGQE